VCGGGGRLKGDLPSQRIDAPDHRKKGRREVRSEVVTGPGGPAKAGRKDPAFRFPEETSRARPGKNGSRMDSSEGGEAHALRAGQETAEGTKGRLRPYSSVWGGAYREPPREEGKGPVSTTTRREKKKEACFSYKKEGAWPKPWTAARKKGGLIVIEGVEKRSGKEASCEKKKSIKLEK